MQGNSVTLANGLAVSVDWLSFTVMSTLDPVDALDLFGFVLDDFTQLEKGARGYKSMYRFNGGSFYMLCNGNDNMGVHFDISGSAVSDFLYGFSETLKVATPFGEGYDIDFDSTMMTALLDRILSHGHITRLDIAIDDIGCSYFTTDDVVRMYDNTQIVSKFRSMRNITDSEAPGVRTGHTVYFGSRTSDIFLRVYDKRLERNRSLSQEDTNTPWVRWELELKNSRAVSAARMLIAGIPLGTVAVGILGHYMRMIVLDDVNRSRCSSYPLWESFIDGISSLRLTVPRCKTTLDDKRSWLKRQVMPTLAAVVLADGGSLEFIEGNLENGLNRMSRYLYNMAISELESD